MGFNYAHALIQNCLAPIWNSVRRMAERYYSNSDNIPGEYVFDFAVVVFGVCTLRCSTALSYSASLSDHHPSRESDNAMRSFQAFGTLS